MFRIATLTAVVALVVAQAALAAPADYGTPGPHTAAGATLTQVHAQQDLRSPDAVNGVTEPVARVDLRSPDAATGFVAPAAAPAETDGGFNWGILGVVGVALAACAALAVMLRRHLDVGRPASV